jgi:hypothetical protein
MDHQCEGLHHYVGIEDIEGKKESIYALIESKMGKYASTTCSFHKGIHHTNNNLRQVLSLLLEGDCEAFIYLEDDTLPSKGAVAFLRREYEKHKDDPLFSHVSLSPLSDGVEPSEETLQQSGKRTDWVGLWGFMAPIRTARAILETTKPYEGGGYVPGTVWDETYSDHFKAKGMYCIQPVVARVQNIGDVDGLHRGSHTFANWEGEQERPVEVGSTYIQLGRIGDIISLLPAFYHEYQRKGRKVGLVVAKAFAEAIEGCSYIQPTILDIDFRRINAALRAVRGAIPTQVVGKKTVISQVYGLKYRVDIKLDSFTKESWRLAGFGELWRHNLPLVIDQRNREREAKLIPEGEFIVVFTEGHSSPFAHTELLLQKCAEWFPGKQIIHNPRGERFHDLIGLMEKAHCIIATDSAPLHLAQAVKTPVIALIADTPSLWHGTAMRRNHIAYARYSRFPAEIPLITESLEEMEKTTEVMHVFTNYLMDEGARKRYEIARSTWKMGYKFGITDSYFAREIEGVPFVKDILRMACLKCDKMDDVILLHNSDTCFYEGTEQAFIEAVRTHGSCYSGRIDYQGEACLKSKQDKGDPYPGTDLFAFTKGWWLESQKEWPDLVVGREAWDMIMRKLIRSKQGVALDGSVFHFRHPTKWESNRMKDKGNIHNRKQARAWLKARNLGLESLAFAEEY